MIKLRGYPRDTDSNASRLVSLGAYLALFGSSTGQTPLYVSVFVDTSDMASMYTYGTAISGNLVTDHEYGPTG